MLLVPGVEHSLFPHQHHVTRRTWDYFVHTCTPPARLAGLRRGRDGHPADRAGRAGPAMAYRIFAPYTRSTVMAISTRRSATMTARYSAQSGCSPAAR